MSPNFSTDFIKESENPLLSLELVSGFTGFFEGSSVRINTTHIIINSDGLRDYNHSIEKENGTRRIIVLGDSYEFGWGVEMNESYPKVLENLLRDDGTYEVLNMGIPGYQLYEKIEFYRYKGEKYNPDIIILGLLGNDFGNNTEIMELISDFKAKLISENKRKIIKLSEQEIAIEADRLATVIIRKKESNLTTEEKWAIFKGPLDDLYNLTHQKNITVILLNHVEMPIPEEISSRISEYVQNKDWFYFTCMNESMLYPELFFPVDGHPISTVHRLMAESIYENMKSKNIV